MARPSSRVHLAIGLFTTVLKTCQMSRACFSREAADAVVLDVGFEQVIVAPFGGGAVRARLRHVVGFKTWTPSIGAGVRTSAGTAVHANDFAGSKVA